jgi:hypothetical protein
MQYGITEHDAQIPELSYCPCSHNLGKQLFVYI